jgi:hypothetical protein
MSRHIPIKIAFCVAYDWEYLRISLPLVYNHADKICLAVDKDRISWAGQPFAFDAAAFYRFTKEIDKDQKIDIYEDDFHLRELAPMQNEVRQRNKMAGRLGNGGWHIQLDTDEYFVNFAGFVKYLQNTSYNRPVNITCPWYTMYKQTPEGYLFIKESNYNNIEFIPVATMHPHYEYGRRNSYFNIRTDFVILHQSWARSENEILQKISNWGHKEDFDVMAYFDKWKALTGENYKEFNDFHPVVPGKWTELEYIPGKDVNALIRTLQINPPFAIDKQKLQKDNSIWRSRIRTLMGKLGLK